jgi:alginate O-acetyltransferase complex protein AlgI
VTLSSWLRDYLYIPLGGSRRGPRRRDVNLLLTMGLGGLWHGAAFSFAAWGLYHGGLLVGHRHLGRLGIPLRGAAATAATFVAVTVGWVFFRMHSAADVGSTFAGLFGLHGFGGVPTGLLPWLLVAALLQWGVPEEWRWRFSGWPVWRFVPLGAAVAVALVLVNSTTRFIYFRF